MVDSGVDLRHPDLRRNLWTNPDELAGNGLDDDHNGYVDDMHGYDFVDRDANPSDRDGHGTHVAGLVTGRGRHRSRSNRVAPRIQVMALRVLGRRHRGTVRTMTAAVDYAVANGARIVNISMTARRRNAALERAIRRARAAGVLLVVSAGNRGRDLGRVPSFPACSRSSNVIAVASLGHHGERSAFSNYGRCVDIAAPGEAVWSTRRGGGYELRSGTSMAAPRVTRAVALAIAARPRVRLGRLVAALTLRPRPRRALARPVRLNASLVLRRLRVARGAPGKATKNVAPWFAARPADWRR